MTGEAILTTAELASIRREYRGATLLPARCYHDEAVLDWERERIVRTDWVMAGRVEDLPTPGSFKLVDIDGESVILVRGKDDVIRAFYNVCRHRGTAVEERECGTAVRFQCPYHAWIYDLDGRLARAKHTEDLEDFGFETFGLRPVHAATWQGFVFLNLSDGSVEPLEAQLGDLVDHFTRFDFSTLRSAKRIDYEVAANWKFIAENYSECYHCPGVHPQLNKLTPYDLGGDYDPDGAWQGGWMELVGGAETMALDGGHGSRHGRPPMCGITAEDEVRIYYYVLWPLTFLSIHPDYLLVHRLEPIDAGHTRVICEWLFEEDTIALPDFDPSEPIAFWDLTNRQDWHVCELQQRGTRSRSWVAGRYSNNEASVQAFDLMVADRYASDGLESHRTVRERYDVPPPRVDPGHHHTGNGTNGAPDDASHHAETDRHTARAKAAGRTP
jgi:glycine betaine catabolism A